MSFSLPRNAACSLKDNNSSTMYSAANSVIMPVKGNLGNPLQFLPVGILAVNHNSEPDLNCCCIWTADALQSRRVQEHLLSVLFWIIIGFLLVLVRIIKN